MSSCELPRSSSRVRVLYSFYLFPFLIHTLLGSEEEADVLGTRECLIVYGHPSLTTLKLSTVEEFMQRKSQAWFEKHPRKPPSDQGVPKAFSAHQKEDDPAFYFSRPSESASTIPVTLYSSIIGHFQDDCERYEPTPDDHSFVLNFSREMSNFLPAEKEQAAAARRLFESYGIPLRGAVIDSYIRTIQMEIYAIGTCLYNIGGEARARRRQGRPTAASLLVLPWFLAG